MNTPSTPAVTVEQIDKDAACDLLRTMGIDIGGITLHWASNAMARHRLAHQSAATGGEGSGLSDYDAHAREKQAQALYFLEPIPSPAHQQWAPSYLDWNDLRDEQKRIYYRRGAVAAERMEALTPTHPNDMARENERLREQLKKSIGEVANLSGCLMNDAVADRIAQVAARLLSTTPSNPPAPSAPSWGDAKTVGNLIAQLQTMDPASAIGAGYFVTMPNGERRAKVRGLTISRERVDGSNIRTGDESVPYSNVAWAAQDERDNPPAPSGGVREHVVKIMYDAWPHKVISKALADVTGMPMGETLTWDAAKAAGADFTGLYRYADAVLAFTNPAGDGVRSEKQQSAIAYATRWLADVDRHMKIATQFPRETMRLLLAALANPASEDKAADVK